MAEGRISMGIDGAYAVLVLFHPACRSYTVDPRLITDGREQSGVAYCAKCELWVALSPADAADKENDG